MALISRLRKRSVKRNRNVIYEDFLKRLGRAYISHFNTPEFNFPSVTEIQSLNVVSHVWTIGDRYEKLAARFYDDPEMWWVIGFFNQKPAEFLLSPGDVVFVPQPLEDILDYIGY